MKLASALTGAVVFWLGTAAAAGSDTSELDARVLSGELSPEDAIAEYCKQETRDKTQDAFCSCPDDALRLLEQRLKSHGQNAT